MSKLGSILVLFLWVNALMSSLSGCSSVRPIQTQGYAKLNDSRTFEYEFPVVWKGIEETFKNYKVLERDPEHVDSLELRKLKKRELKTDWIYSQSRDKYVEYTVNAFPRKQYLQTRTQYQVVAERVMGGVAVQIRALEEIESLKPDGSSAGYSEAKSPDTARINEVLEKIQNSILSAAP